MLKGTNQMLVGLIDYLGQGVFLFLTSCVQRDEGSYFLWDSEEVLIYTTKMNKPNVELSL